MVKITITNSERDPQTGNSKEAWSVECAATWPAQKRNSVFAGKMMQEIADGSRTASTLNAQGRQGFSNLNLEVTFQKGSPSSDLLVGEGRIFER